MKPKLLDLFCGAGGATRGYQLAGFHVTGVDIKLQPRYIGDVFHCADALTFPLEGFDAIHASPPCQRYSTATLSQRGNGIEYPDLVAAVRVRLVASGLPYIIENVPGAPLLNPIMLCGSSFGLRLTRHRLFETNVDLFSLVPPCQHHPNPVVVAGHNTPSWSRKKNGGKNYTIAERIDAMGIDWMRREELSLSIPPAYTEWIGRRILESA